MNICPLIPDTSCPYCGIGLIGKIVSCDLKNPEDYLEGLVIITTYLLEVSDYHSPGSKTFFTVRYNSLSHHQNSVNCVKFRPFLQNPNYSMPSKITKPQ